MKRLSSYQNQPKQVTMNESMKVRTDGISLLKAVYQCRLRLTRLLLEGGAYINESNEHGETPLMVACKTDYSDSQSVPKCKMVQYLLEKGADPNIQDKLGKTALMHACLDQAGAEILSVLLSSGAEPTLEDHTGLSALVYAASSGHWDILQILMDACRVKGKEVIIITTNKLPSGHQMTKQYLNVPPPPDLEEQMQLNNPSGISPCENQLQAPLQGSSARATPPLGNRLLDLGNPHSSGSAPGLGTSRPHSSIQDPSPLQIPTMDKLLKLQRQHSYQLSKSPSLLLQQSQASSLTEEVPEKTELGEDLCFRDGGLVSHGRPLTKDTQLLKGLKNIPGSESRGGVGRRGFGRKMSYDSTASSQHSASHPNLHQNLPLTLRCGRAGEDSSDEMFHVSSLQNVFSLRNTGIDHYSSDSQLPHFSSQDNHSKNIGETGAGAERHRLSNRSSTLSDSRDSVKSSIQRRGAAGMEHRGSGAHLLDHMSITRPGYLSPLNPHARIMVTSGSSHSLTEGGKTVNSVLPGSKPVLHCAPIFPRDLKVKKMLWRRHSMQSEQIKDLVNFEKTFER